MPVVIELIPIANALRTMAASLADVRRAYLGVAPTVPSTPVAEIVFDTSSIQYLPGQPTPALEWVLFYVGIIVGIGEYREGAEEKALTIAQDFAQLFAAPGFDPTLGGLVEDTRPTGIAGDFTDRGGKAVRVAAVSIYAGEPPARI